MYLLYSILSALFIVWLLTRNSGKSTSRAEAGNSSRYFEPPADMPKGWDCCRYCGHVYDPETVKYETPVPFKLPTEDDYLNRMIALHEPKRLMPTRQLLQGDCPKCGE